MSKQEQESEVWICETCGKPCFIQGNMWLHEGGDPRWPQLHIVVPIRPPAGLPEEERIQPVAEGSGLPPCDITLEDWNLAWKDLDFDFLAMTPRNALLFPHVEDRAENYARERQLLDALRKLQAAESTIVELKKDQKTAREESWPNFRIGGAGQI